MGGGTWYGFERRARSDCRCVFSRRDVGLAVSDRRGGTARVSVVRDSWMGDGWVEKFSEGALTRAMSLAAAFDPSTSLFPLKQMHQASRCAHSDDISVGSVSSHGSYSSAADGFPVSCSSHLSCPPVNETTQRRVTVRGSQKHHRVFFFRGDTRHVFK